MLSKKPWRPEAVLFLGCGLFASISLGAGLVNLADYFLDGTDRTQTKMLTFIVGTLSFHGAAFVGIALFIKEHGIGWNAAFGFSSHRRGRTIGLAVLTAFLALPIAMGLGQLSEAAIRWAHRIPVAQQAVQTLQETTSTMLQVYFGGVAVLIAPVAEEMLFRGILYPAIKQRGFARLALWGTSILFAVSHANLLTLAPLIFLAVALTLLYEATDNLLAPILTHSLFNLVNFFLLVMNRPSA